MPAAPPARRLPERAKTLWRVVAVGQAVAAVMVAVAVGQAWPPVVAAVAVLGLVHVVLTPLLRWRRWRYEVREEEIDLQHGVVVRVRTLVPMARVQHVDTRQGPLEQSVGLATVVFHTAAGARSIPALAEAEAVAVRDRIAALSGEADGV